MKHFIALMLLLACPFTFAQVLQYQKNSSDSSRKITELKSKISFAIDSLKTKATARTITKTIVVNHYSVKEKIVYRDTCLTRDIRKFNVAPVHDTIEIKSDTVFIKKVKWYQFRKRHKQNIQSQIKSEP